jgi:cytidine deaminase
MKVDVPANWANWLEGLEDPTPEMLEANLMPPTDRDQDLSILKLRNGIGLDPYYVAEQLWFSRALHDWASAAARWYARSYRGFNVGAIGFGYDFDLARHGIRFGFNQKLHADDPMADSMHAEQVVIRKLLDSAYPHITAIAIYGPVQPDTHSGRETPTLHPCGICRSFMANTPQIDPYRTLIFTIRDEDTSERFVLQELLQSHGDVPPVRG